MLIKESLSSSNSIGITILKLKSKTFIKEEARLIRRSRANCLDSYVI